MRFFDVFGALFIAAWLCLVGAFAFFVLGDERSGLSMTGGNFTLQEGTHWMSLHQAGEDAGVMREVRTRLLDGWLIETKAAIQLSMLQRTFGLQLDSKTVLTEELLLKNALATVEVLGMKLHLDARVDESDDAFQLNARVTLNDAHETFSIPLESRPLLASHAMPKMLAADDLLDGNYLEEQFFDPMTLSPTKIRLTYEGQEMIEHYGESYQAHRFRQKISGMDALTYTDHRGDIIRQALPMQFSMGRVPDFLGNQLLRQWEETIDSQDQSTPAFLQNLDAKTLLSLLNMVGGGQLNQLQDAIFESIEDHEAPHSQPEPDQPSSADETP